MEGLFPYKPCVDYSALKITDEGRYSITKKYDSQQITSILLNLKNISTESTITDATACVGGDTINFGLHFQNVKSIELEPDNFDALVNNVQTFQMNNVILYNADAVKIFKWYTDILYIDPPWGGRGYKKYRNFDIYISKKRIDIWIEEILARKTKPKYIAIKLPFNYRFTRLMFLENTTIKSYQINSYVLLVIENR
jgi:hypothetical protein